MNQTLKGESGVSSSPDEDVTPQKLLSQIVNGSPLHAFFPLPSFPLFESSDGKLYNSLGDFSRTLRRPADVLGALDVGDVVKGYLFHFFGVLQCPLAPGGHDVDCVWIDGADATFERRKTRRSEQNVVHPDAHAKGDGPMVRPSLKA